MQRPRSSPFARVSTPPSRPNAKRLKIEFNNDSMEDFSDSDSDDFLIRRGGRGGGGLADRRKTPAVNSKPLKANINPFVTDSSFEFDASCLSTDMSSSTSPGHDLTTTMRNSLCIVSPMMSSRKEMAETPQAVSLPAPPSVQKRRPSPGAPSSLKRQTSFNAESEQDDRYRTEFEELGALGGGTFGTVYKARKRLDGCLYAVKRTNNRFRSKRERERVLKEVFALAALQSTQTNNPHIVRYFSAWVEDHRLFIQTELCDASMADMMRGVAHAEQESVALEVVRQLLQGLKALHDTNLVHLDVKPANIFVKNGVYKLGDLGHASIARISSCDVEEDYEEGDSRYMALELLNRDSSSALVKADIFSLGASAYEMMRGKNELLPAVGSEWHDIRNGRLTFPESTSFPARALIASMLAKNVASRPDANALLSSGGPDGILKTKNEKENDALKSELASLKRMQNKPQSCTLRRVNTL